MKRRFVAVFFIISMFLTLPAHAATARIIAVAPSLKFDGTTATCYVGITADRPADKISATMELWQGNTLIDSWSGTGTWTLKLEKTATVSKNKTYDLIVSYSVNGVEKTPVSTSRTNKQDKMQTAYNRKQPNKPQRIL